MLVHYALTFLPPYLSTSNCLCLECHRGKSGRRELNRSQLTYWVLSPVQLQFPVSSSRLIVAVRLRDSDFFAVLVERLGQVLRDVVGGTAFDLMALQHVDELPILEQRDLG